jgi:two-component system sensor histidine kinase GlrK
LLSHEHTVRLYYPKSFLQLILIGFALVALPLVIPVIHATLYVDRLALQSQKAVREAVQATQSSWMLVEQVTAMERSARQFVVLGDPSLFQGYTKIHDQFNETVAKLSSLKLDPRQREQLTELSSQELSLFRSLQGEPHDSEVARLAVEKFYALTELAQSILSGSSRVINREVDVMQNLAAEAQRKLALQTLSVIPLALLLAGAFVYLIARPIRQIDTSIHRLGGGDFSSNIRVEGPQDLENLGKRLDWLRLRLVELEAQRTKLMRHISHELKTPLAALREGTALLSDQVVGTLTGEQAEIAGILQQNALQLQKRIEDLLNFSVAQQRDSTLQVTPVELRSLMESVARNHKPTMMSRGLRLDLDAEEVTVAGDEEKLVIVMDNLLSNAIKYSPEGGAILLRLNQNDGLATIDIVDQGPGIASEEQQDIFKPFFQGKGARANQVAGTGLGLAIAREYITAHHGSIDVIPEVDSGAHFRVVLPTDLSWSIQ